MGADRFRLGVDFGTSNTVAVLADPDGRVRPLVFDGSLLLASAVFAGPGSGLLVGADAVRAAVGYPAGLELNPKRRIDDGTVWLGEREFPVAELIAAVLRRVAAEASRVAGGPVDEVVLTHPAAWARPRLGLLADAANRAGLGETRFVAEPVAAAAYFATVVGRRFSPQRCVVVYDLGAGTFDVSVVRPRSSGFDVVAADGLADVGGLDLDAVVVRHARSLTSDAGAQWQRLDWPQSTADQQARQTLWHAARAVKEQLSRHSSGSLHLPLVDRQVHLTREEFEVAARPYLDRASALTMRVLAEAGVPPEDVEGVFLVGGSSRIPLAATSLHRTLRLAPTVIDQPELVVAEGAIHCDATAAPVAGPVGRVAAPVTDPVGGVAAPVGDPPAPVAAVDDHVFPVASTVLASAAAVEAIEPTSPAVGASFAPPVSPAPARAAPPRSPQPTVPRSTSLFRRRSGRLVAAVAVLLVLATAGILAVTRPWENPRTGDTGSTVGKTGPTVGDTGPTVTGPQRLGDPLTGHTGSVHDVAFSPDGRTLATAGDDKTVRLWDVTNRQTIATLTAHSESVNGVAFSPDGRVLATTSDDKTVWLWDVASRQRIGAALTGHTDEVYGVAFSPDGKTLATGSNDDTVRLWDVASGRPVGSPLTGHTECACVVAFSPDGKILATASQDRTVRLWDVTSLDPVGSPLTGETGLVNGMAFEPDGAVLATVGADKVVRLWDVASRKPVGTPLVELTAGRDVAFSPDGRTLATVGLDLTLRLWDMTNHRLIATVTTGHTVGIYTVAFSSDGRTIVTAGGDHTAQLWRTTS